jgi:succinate dehydrogenase/fumarate reductase flavoprotein subunit
LSKEEDTDVIVVGGGGSGLAAAIEARTLSRRVVLLEKNPKLGGSTAWSVGSISATNTPHQMRLGIQDSPEDHFEDLGLFCQKTGLPDNLALRRILIDNVSDTFRWLMSMGVVFHGPLQQAPHRKPRMHNVLPNSRAYIYHLGRHARRIGVDIRTQCRVEELMLEDGVVVGVVYRQGDNVHRLRALGGVVLASGDFGGNATMREQYISKAVSLARPINPTNTGDGHKLVEALGGTILNRKHHLAGVRFAPPPDKWILKIPPYAWVTRGISWSLENMPSWLLRPFVMSFLTTVLQSSPELYRQGAVLINREGCRFNDELSDPTRHLPDQPKGEAFILLDGRLVELFSKPPFHVSTAPGIAYGYIDDYRRSRKDIFHQADDLRGLAKSLGMDADKLIKTVDQYNQSSEQENNGVSARGRRSALNGGPWVALGPVSYFITFTDSGVAANEQHQVLAADGEPVVGLYAAGFIGMGGMLLEGLGHHLGWAFTSGRRAGRNAAFRVVTPDVSDADKNT